MRALALTILGAVVWAGLRGRVDVATLAFGAIVGATIAYAVGLRWHAPSQAARAVRALAIVGRLTLFFAAAVILSNAKQLRIIFSPRVQIQPRWVHVTSQLAHPATRATLGVLVSMTPGTVTTDLDGKRLSIHALSAESDDAVIEGSLARFEALLLELEAI